MTRPSQVQESTGASVTTYVVPGSIRHHLNRECSYLRRARRVVETVQPNLWPGFVCETCRAALWCDACMRAWPYCECPREETP